MTAHFLNRDRAVRSVSYRPTKGKYPFTLSTLFKRGASGALWLPSAHRKSIEQSLTQDAIFYQDSSGTTPVTADSDPVGLALEISKWNGKTLSEYLAGQPELVTNGGFGSGTSGWTEVLNGTIDTSGGTMLATATTGNTGVYQDMSISVGGYGYVSWDVVSGSEPRIAIYDGASFSTLLYTENGVSSGQATLKSTTGILRVYAHAAVGHTAEFDNVSVKEVEGDHFYQTTDANRPTLDITNGKYSWVFNGTNSALVSDFAGGAGPSDCSVFVALKTTDTQFVLVTGHTNSYYMIAAENGAASTQLHNQAGSPAIYICDAGAGETTLSAFAGTTRGELRTALADDTWKIVELRNPDFSAWTAFHMAGYSGVWRFGGSIGPTQIIESGPILEASRAKIVKAMIEELP